MKTKHIFWGSLFIAIGLLILLYNLNVLRFDLTDLWKFWPSVLILWGVSYFIHNKILKGIVAGIAAIMLAITLFGFISSSFNVFYNAFNIDNDGVNISFDSNTDTSNYVESYNPETKICDFYLNAGAGAFILNDSTDNLLSAATQGVKNNYEINRSDSGDKSTITMKMLKKHFIFNDGHNRNKTILKLNTNPVWNLNFDIGAASLDYDLSPFKTDNVNIKMGAASMKVKLGDKSEVTNFTLKAGVSSIDIEVPQEAGCEIRCNTSLSSKDFNEFNKVDSNLYRTDNFGSAKKKIYINLETGISSIHVSRFGGSWE